MDFSPLKRALQSAPERSAAAAAVADREFFCFRLGELRLGVPSEFVREVVRAGVLTPLPRTPAFILGVCGHRGEVMPVIDLLRFLGKGEARVGLRTRLFVGTTESYTAALAADAIIGLRRIQVQHILPPPLGSDANAEHLIGVVTETADPQPLTLLDFGRVMQSARNRAVGR
ncbi:MAG: chemotaxis protein CheW [Myxococcaceae bacterium]